MSPEKFEANEGSETSSTLSSELRDIAPDSTAKTAPASPEVPKVDVSEASYAVDKLRASGPPIGTDPTGYGQRGEYKSGLEPPGVGAAREAAWREREGLPPSGQPTSETGFLAKIAGLFKRKSK